MSTRQPSTLAVTTLMAAICIGGMSGRVSAADIFVTAAVGQPYGVATIEVPVDAPAVGRQFSPLGASDSQDRILFPVSDDIREEIRPETQQPPQRRRGRFLNRVSGLIRELTNDDVETKQTVARRISFLFTGSEPLRVRLADARGDLGTYEIVPRPDGAAYDEVLGQWWNGYTAAAKQQIDSADYPTSVEDYLVAMLAGRLALPLPQWYTDTVADQDELLDTLKLVAGAKAISQAAFRQVAAGYAETDVTAALSLPPPPNWNTDRLPSAAASVATEPLASRVPPECFYIRYGSFKNFLWFRDLSNEYGGDLSRMATLSSLENGSMKLMENQLNVKTTQMSRMLGPTVIDDQAIIGRDLFFNDGASMGVLFKAKNAFLLRTSLMGDRTATARDDDSVALKDIKIADRPVSFLHSTDNRVRSFLAQDGEYLLVTNSRALVQRFFEVGQSGQSLAETPSFQLARELMPLNREDTIFAYFSPAMLQGLVSPQYMIELRRRLYARSEIALVHLARLAAAADGTRVDTPVGIEDLSEAGFLPNRFGPRPDGSGVITVGQQVMDTLRGARGTFLPIADVEVDLVTAEESTWYQQIAQQYTQRFPSMDPIMVGVQRNRLADEPDVEQVTVHAEVAPWDPSKYGTLSQQLGPPTNVAIEFAPDDIVAAQAHVASATLGPPTHLFAAIKDSMPPEPEDFNGVFNIYRSLRRIPGYLGAWPQPGALDRLPLGLGRGQPVSPGMNRLIGGMYRYTDGQFSVLSFQPTVIDQSLPHLAAIDVPGSAQVRAHIGNLRGSQLESWVNNQLYERARKSSLSGAEFLSLLSSQMQIPPADVPNAAERVLGARLQCTLGGQYEYSTVSGRYISTAWGGESAPPKAPLDYVAPAMTWFRGATTSLTQFDDRLVADAVIYVARQ